MLKSARRACALTAAVALSFTVQGGEPLWTVRDGSMLIDHFGLLSEGQRNIVLQLLEDYESNWVTTEEELLSELTQHHESPGEVWLDAAMQSHWAAVNSLNSQFSDQVRLVLPDEQHQQWNSLERGMLILRRLPRGILRGESVDPRILAHALEDRIPSLAGEETAAVLANWEEQISPLLQSRLAFDIAGPFHFQHLIMSGQYLEALRYRTNWIKLQLTIREITRTTMERLAELSSPADATQIRNAWLQAIRQDTPLSLPVDRVFKRALTDDSIDQTVKSEVADLFHEYLAATNPIQRHQRDVLWKLEPLSKLAAVQRLAGQTVEATPLKEARDANVIAGLQISRAYLTKLCRVLGQEWCLRQANLAQESPRVAQPLPIPNPHGIKADPFDLPGGDGPSPNDPKPILPGETP
jgi:hypothetical protein